MEGKIYFSNFTDKILFDFYENENNLDFLQKLLSNENNNFENSKLMKIKLPQYYINKSFVELFNDFVSFFNPVIPIGIRIIFIYLGIYTLK